MSAITEFTPVKHVASSRQYGPKGHPILGVAHKLRRDPLKFFIDSLLDYGDVVWFRVGRDQVVMLNDPSQIRHVLQDNYRNYEKSKFYKPLKPILGNGIFLSEGSTWLKQRRTATPAFGRSRFEHTAQQVIDATCDLLDQWRERYRGGQAFDLSFEMMRVTMDGVTRAFFDHRLADEHASVHHALAVILKEMERRVWSVVRLPETLHTWTHQPFRRALVVLDDLVRKLVEQRRRAPRDTGDLLTTLLREHGGDPNSDQRELLRDQVVSIIIAGHETTANALTWALYLLSKFPSAAKRLYDEVDRVLDGRRPTVGDLQRLTYTRMVFEEAMRLYPPVWTISRKALERDTMSGLSIPAGTTVMLSPYAVQRHPGLWDNPEGFDPERFLPEEVACRPRHAYFPFGGGPRVCLGQRFAIMEAQLILAMIVQAYRIDLVPGQTILPEPMITLRPNGPVVVTIGARGEK